MGHALGALRDRGLCCTCIMPYRTIHSKDIEAMETMQKKPVNAFQTGIPVAKTVVDGGQYLTLGLGGEEYAVDILRVQEIRSYEGPTRMVNAPSFIKGVVN